MKCHLAHLPARCADRPPLSGPDMMLVYAWLAAPAARPKYRRKVDLAKGKRWFCSSEEAEAAGCRRSKL